jgi:hypothetical protein
MSYYASGHKMRFQKNKKSAICEREGHSFKAVQQVAQRGIYRVYVYKFRPVFHKASSL